MISQNLLDELRKPLLTPSDVIDALDKASRYWINGDRSIAEDAEIAIRLMDRSKEFEDVLPGSNNIIEALAREAGLFPYLEGEHPLRDDIALEAHRVPGLPELIFHTEQQNVFTKLSAGENIVLSAPTSFGKTLLVDALIAFKNPHLVVIVVPTIALLEERRRTLIDRFPKYHVITQSFQEISANPTIIVGTQERILERREMPSPDLFVIDEFYKLDLTNGNIRAKSLNLLLAKYIDVAKQVYLLGPSIEKNPVGENGRRKFEFVKTDYSPVTADIERIDPPGADPDQLYDLLTSVKVNSSLVYCRSPKSSRVVSRELAARGYTSDNPLLQRLAEWLRDNYHDNWYVADALENGIGIHHGRIPRAIGHLMVRLFNEGEINVLLCTSSLIEGVNTVAETVVIYDKYISIRKLDRFTFDNIKGRAGRMFRHFVGKIYIFDEAPEPIYDTLEIPLLKERGDFTDQELLQLSDNRLSENNLARKNLLLERLEVPREILEKYARFGISEIENLFLELTELIDSGDKNLFWSGIGRYPEILRSMEGVWGRIEFEKHGVRSARQFAFLSNKLQRSATLKDFLTTVANGDDIDDSIDLAFNFLKGAEYSFIDPLSLLNDLVNTIVEDACDYSKFIADLASWGLPGHSKALEEVGVPAPIIQRLEGVIDVHDIDAAVSDVRRLMGKSEMLSAVDIELLQFTLAG